MVTTILMFGRRHSKRQFAKLACRLTPMEQAELVAMSIALHRAPTDAEVREKFGKVTRDGRRIMPDGSGWKGVQRDSYLAERNRGKR